MNFESDVLAVLRELSDEERLDAKDRARSILAREIGERPTRSTFADVSISEYPVWVRRLVGLLMLVVFVAAAMPSLFRLYAAGRSYYLLGIDSEWQAAIVGVSTFLLAEFLIITSTLAASIFFTGWKRLAFVMPIGLGLAVAFVGNWTIVNPHDLFAWLETLVPPLAVLVMSFVGERLILDSVKQSHATERAFQEAVAAWSAAQSLLENHSKWPVVYGRVLRDALIEANSKGTGAKDRKEFMAGLTRKEWGIAVRRELSADSGAWLEAEPIAIKPVEVATKPVEVPFGSTAHLTGEHGYIPVMQSANGHIANGKNPLTVTK